MKLRFTSRATQDLADIADYIHTRSPSAAQQVRAALLHSLQKLVLFPHAGRRQSVADVRKLITNKFHYLVYYTVDEPGEEIVSLSIRHPVREREQEDA